MLSACGRWLPARVNVRHMVIVCTDNTCEVSQRGINFFDPNVKFLGGQLTPLTHTSRAPVQLTHLNGTPSPSLLHPVLMHCCCPLFKRSWLLTFSWHDAPTSDGHRLLTYGSLANHLWLHMSCSLVEVDSYTGRLVVSNPTVTAYITAGGCSWFICSNAHVDNTYHVM